MKTILRQVEETRTAWFVLANSWEYSHYILGFSGIISTSLSNILKSSNSRISDICSIIAVICVSYLTFLNPKQKADQHWKAYDQLNFAYLEYQIARDNVDESQHKEEMQKLIKAWKEATSFLKEGETKISVGNSKD